MNYDDWKTENRDDYEDRIGLRPRRHRDDEPAGASGGFCACGVDTERSVAGIGWQCRKCGEAAIQRVYQQAARKVS